jgi:hypothetical protein
MSLTPVPFVRVGFAILGLGLASAILTAAAPGETIGAARAGLSLTTLLATLALGEAVLRRALARAEAVAKSSRRTPRR